MGAGLDLQGRRREAWDELAEAFLENLGYSRRVALQRLAVRIPADAHPDVVVVHQGGLLDPDDWSAAWIAPDGDTRSAAQSTSSSVSGRGTSTSAPTSSSRPWNSFSPSR